MTEERGIDEKGRQRIAEFVHAWMGWQGREARKNLAGSGRISKATIDRAVKAEEISETMLRALGDVMKLPRDFLLYIGYGQIEEIEAASNDADLVRWTLSHLFTDDNGNAGPSGQRVS